MRAEEILQHKCLDPRQLVCVGRFHAQHCDVERVLDAPDKNTATVNASHCPPRENDIARVLEFEEIICVCE